jgi:hypothetical protein
VWVSAEALLGVSGTLRDVAGATTFAVDRRLSSRASTQVRVVAAGVCGSALDRTGSRSHRRPVAVIAC